MTRKTILKLTTLLTCSLFALAVSGCKDSESEKAAKDARESITNSNRLIKSSTDKTTLTEAEMKKVAAIPGDANSVRLKQERQQIAKLVANRLAATAGDSRFEDINAEIEALQTSEINSQEDFDNICTQLIGITDKIIEISKSAEESVAAAQSTKIEAALTELKKASQAIRQSPSEDNRRSTLQAASSLSLAAIYASQARAEHENLTLDDISIHAVLMSINNQVHEVRKANLEALAANSSRPDKAIDGLNQQLTSAKESLRETQAKLETSKTEYAGYESDYNTNITKANEYRNKYLQTLSKADKAEGSEKYKLEIEATIQRVGKENLKEWANKWIADGKDDEMEMYINSSQEIIGGIHFETQAELAKLQMDSIKTQINYYETLINNTSNRVVQLDAYISKIMNSDENLGGIENRISQADTLKAAAIAKIKTSLDNLATIEASHKASSTAATDLYQSAIDNLEQYASLTRSFGEFDPENFKALVVSDLNRLHEADADFYNSSLSVLENVRSLPELAENALELTEDYKVKSQEAMDAVITKPADAVEMDNTEAIDTTDTTSTTDDTANTTVSEEPMDEPQQ